ncbi:MAG TPA: hypothetical protein VKD72_27085 [Gemmataceae bacterium]|nr:hypothetical protein [Gemmataceae bacterium]
MSKRARRFIQTWQRCPYVKDLGQVRAAIEEAGLPVTEPVLDFHRTFAGYMTNVWGDEGPLGIIHREVSRQSWFRPMKVGGYLTVDPPSLACADIHISWEMMIDLDGKFHCNGPESSSYFMWTEQCAFLWEFAQTYQVRRVDLAADPDELAAVLLPRLTDRRIVALSDQYGQVYATDQLVVSVGQQGQRYDVLVVKGKRPAELAGLKAR